MLSPNKFRNLLVFIIFLFSAIFLLFILKGSGGNPSPEDLKKIPEYSLRDRGRFLQTRNLVENHSFSLNREQAELAAPDAGYYNGKWYLLYPPGLSMLAVPFYLVGLYINATLLFVFLMSILFALGNIIFVYLIANKIFKLPLWTSLFSSLIFGFATTALGYSTSLFQHQAAAFFILSSFYAVYKYKMHPRWGFLWAIYVWLLYAFAFFVDYPNALLMLPIVGYLVVASLKFEKTENKFKLRIRSALILTCVFFIGASILHGYFNKSNFGSWTKLSGSLTGFREGVDKSLDKGTYEQDKAKFTATEIKKSPVNFFSEFKIREGIEVILFSRDRGLFVFTPILILGVLGLFLAFKNSDLEHAILASTVGLVIFFYGSWGDPWAGWAFGPRYLIPIMPILAIYVGYFLNNITRYRLTVKIFTFILFIYSSAVAFLGAVTTNAVPPDIEAVHLNSKYGFAFNIDQLIANKTNSFAYNYFFHTHLSLIQYWAILLTIISLIAAFTLFILPRFEKDK